MWASWLVGRPLEEAPYPCHALASMGCSSGKKKQGGGVDGSRKERQKWWWWWWGAAL